MGMGCEEFGECESNDEGECKCKEEVRSKHVSFVKAMLL